MLIVISAISARTASYLSSVTLISLMRSAEALTSISRRHFVAHQPNLHKVVVDRSLYNANHVTVRARMISLTSDRPGSQSRGAYNRNSSPYRESREEHIDEND